MRGFFVLLTGCAVAASASAVEVTPLRTTYARSNAQVRLFSGPGAITQPYQEVAVLKVQNTHGRYDAMVQLLLNEAARLRVDGLLLDDMTARGQYDALSATAVVLLGKPDSVAPGAKTKARSACEASSDLCKLERTCEKGFLPACVALGLALQDGRDLEKDLSRAADLFEAACFKGYALACTHYGYALYQGLGRPNNDTDAIVQFKGACDAGDVGGCRYLAVLYLASASSLASYARPFLRQACDGNDSWSCWRLGRMLQLGEGGGPGAEEDVSDLYARACKLGLEQGCYAPSSMPVIGLGRQ